MKPVECEFEADVLAAALQSRWPDGVDAQLRAHVAGCGICSDVAAIAGAMDAAREEISASAVVVPDSGRVWRVAQIRARREAVETAGRPITAIQVMALACAFGLLGACFGATSEWFQLALRRIELGLAGFDFKALLVEHGVIVLAMAAVIFLVPAAVYFAVGRD